MNNVKKYGFDKLAVVKVMLLELINKGMDYDKTRVSQKSCGITGRG